MKIIKLNAIDSTNNYLLKLLRDEPLESTTVVVTEVQKKGRGQRENKWISTPQKSLTFSIFKRYSGISMKDQFSISMAVSIGIKNTLERNGVPDVTVKWPNDIMSRSKKLAGILIENQSKGSMIVSSVIGIGINVNEDQFNDLPLATSLFLSSGKKFSRENLLRDLIQGIETELARLIRHDFKPIHNEFVKHLYKKGVVSVFKEPQGKPFNGCIQGVSSSGELMIECDDEKVRSFRMKEIEYLS